MVRLDPIQSEPPLQFGTQKQLLVDTEVKCDWWKVRRVQEKVREHPLNPIIEAEQPWEEETATEGAGTYPTSALYDDEEGIYKLWYSLNTPRSGSVTCYATSSDGIRWEKPSLGLVEYGGTNSNNVCLQEPEGKPVKGLHIVQDPRRKCGDRRFEAVSMTPYHEDGTTYGGWGSIGYSATGTTWHHVGGGQRQGAGGGNPSCVWDEVLERYVMFQRQLTERAMPRDYPASIGRYIVRQESEDLMKWSPRQTVFNPVDARWPEVESMMVFRHEGIYFGLPQMLENEIRGEVELHLVTNRDGFRWEHPFPDEAFLPRGPRLDFDDMITWFGLPVIRGDEIKIYYGGAQYPHSKPIVASGGDGGLAEGRRQNRIGLATVPLDRMIGLRADEPWGAFLTRPFVVEGDDLYINANVDRELRVEVVDPVGRLVDIGRKSHIGHYIAGEERVYTGFELDNCPVVIGDSLRHRIVWNGGSLGRLKGQAVRLRFLARMATMYSFQVA